MAALLIVVIPTQLLKSTHEVLNLRRFEFDNRTKSSSGRYLEINTPLKWRSSIFQFSVLFLWSVASFTEQIQTPDTVYTLFK